MELGIFAKTFKADHLDGILDKVKQHPFSCIQFNMQCAGLDPLPWNIPKTLPAAIGKLMLEKQLSMAAVSCTFNMIHPNLLDRTQGLESLKVIGAACAAMGTEIVTLCTGSRNAKNKWAWHPNNSSPEAWKDLLATMSKAIVLAEDFDFYLGVEPEMANVVRTPELALQLIETLQSDRIKIILDPANLFERAKKDKIQKRLLSAIDLLIEHTVIVHGKDRTEDGQFKAAGKGAVDFPFFINALKQAGYDGPVILHGLEEHEVEESANLLKKLIETSDF